MKRRDGGINYGNFVLLGLFFLGFLVLTSGVADARSAYLTAFTTKYTATTGTKLDDCNTCHGSGGTSTWNPYGQAIRSLGSAVAIATRITNVESLDSDGDGINNVTEINGITFPGDPSDPPVGALAISTASPLPAGTMGTAYSQTFAATAGTAPYTWSVSAGTLPAGLNLSAAGVLSGTPTAAGTSNFTVQVTGGGTATKAFSVTINAAVAAGPMTVTPSGGLTSSGTAGGPFTPPSVTYTVTNTGASPMNWTATNVASWVILSNPGGTLPAGANTTVTASIGTGANSLAAGSYSDNITFTNTSNGTGNATRPVSLTVNATEAPTISTVSLPAGAVNTAYNQTLAATGGTTPYSWSVSAGTLPAGLSLSAAGVLDGMPTAEGTSSFTVRVAGANSASSTKDFSVTINAAAPPPPITLSSDSGGGSCSVAVRPGSGGSAIDGTLILAGLGMAVWGIRIRRRRG